MSNRRWSRAFSRIFRQTAVCQCFYFPFFQFFFYFFGDPLAPISRGRGWERGKRRRRRWVPLFGHPRKISLLPFFFNLALSSSLLGRYAHVYIRSVIVRYFRQRSFLSHFGGGALLRVLFTRISLLIRNHFHLFLRSVMFVITGSLERGGIYIIREKGEGRSRPPPLFSPALLLIWRFTVYSRSFPSKDCLAGLVCPTYANL